MVRQDRQRISRAQAKVMEKYKRNRRATAMFTLGGSPPFRPAAATNSWHSLAHPEKAANGFDELGHRDRLRQISLATAFTDTPLIPLHRKGGYRDHRNGLELGILLEPLGHFETGDLRQLNIHQDQIGTPLAGEIEHLEAVARPDGAVAVSLQQVVKELHVELVVLHDHYCLRHLSTFWKLRSPATARGGMRATTLDKLRL